MRTNVPLRTASDALSYDDLYSRWERGNWRAMEIDFREDARHWQEVLTDFEREAALWNYALFVWGEDAVADGLSPYIDAAPLEEQKYFLATQHLQVSNGDTRVGPGLAPSPTVTLRCSYEDWADLIGGRQDGLRLAASRRLRPSGDLRWLWSARRMFPR